MNTQDKLCELCVHKSTCDIQCKNECRREGSSDFFVERTPDVEFVGKEYTRTIETQLRQANKKLEVMTSEHERAMRILDNQAGGKHFAGDVMQRIQQKVLKEIENFGWLSWQDIPKFKIEPQVFIDAYASIDMTKITRKVAELIEDKVARKIFDKVEEEIANDVKRAVGTGPVRNEIRNACVKVIHRYAYKINGEKS